MTATLLLLSGVARAASDPTAPGRLDLGYGTNGVLKTFLGGSKRAEVPLRRAIVLADGRVVSLADVPIVARITALGHLDSRFGAHGSTSIALNGDGNDRLDDFAIAPGGGIVLAGTRREDQLAVVRLTPDGRPDPKFNGGSPLTIPTNSYLYNVATTVGPDGTIYVAATSDVGFGIEGARELLCAIRADGTPDPAFGSNGVTTLPVSTSYSEEPRLVRLADGALRFLAVRSTARDKNFVAGVDATGQPDSRLGATGVRELGLDIQPSVLSAAPGDGLLLTGYSGDIRPVLARLNADGSVDAGFGSGGVQRLSTRASAVPGAAVAGRGLIAVALSTKQATDEPPSYGRLTQMAVELLHASGTPVASFGRNGYVALPARKSRAVSDDVGFDRLGGLIVAGSVGDGLSSIRDDYGPDAEVFARLRTRRATVQVGRRWRVDRRGVAHVPLRCIAADPYNCAGTLTVGHATRRFDLSFRRAMTVTLPRGAFRLLPGHSRTLRARVVQHRASQTNTLDRFALDVRAVRRR